jgi:hypothetical protein
MIFFGTLGLLQIFALPGLILIKALKVRGGLVERMILLLPAQFAGELSAVFLLTVAGIYIRLGCTHLDSFGNLLAGIPFSQQFAPAVFCK